MNVIKVAQVNRLLGLRTKTNTNENSARRDANTACWP